MLRIFIASSIDRFPGLTPLMEDLESIKGSRPVRTRELHLTFSFIGEISGTELRVIQDRFAELQCDRYILKLSGLGSFPAAGRARVLFINVEQNTEIMENWLKISSLTGNTVSPEREFIPHITVCRFRIPCDTSSLVTKYKYMGFTQQIQKISIFRSVLSGDGPEYDEICALQLK